MGSYASGLIFCQFDDYGSCLHGFPKNERLARRHRRSRNRSIQRTSISSRPPFPVKKALLA